MDSLPVWANAAVVLTTFFAIAIGAKWLVDSAAALAQRIGISELTVGLTVVAFGTSAPEFGVTMVAAIENQNSISIGNIVGSNIFNLGFILGSAALLRAIPTDALLVWRDTFVLACATLVLYLLVGIDLHLSAVDGVVLVTLLVAYLVLVWRGRYKGTEVGLEIGDAGPRTDRPLWMEGIFLAVGMTLITVASHFLIGSATSLARSFGVSEWAIAVTLVAAGTSVPELATTIAGIARGHTAISAGNVIGSDIFNMLGVLGLAGILHPMSLAPAARTSLLALVAMAFVVLVMMRSGWKLSRAEGLALVALAALRWVLDFGIRG
jgi:cation:H+ antiporter